jgi:hypothetical protein
MSRLRPKKIVLLPLAWLDQLVRFLWSERTYKQVFAPARAEIIREWNDAAILGEVWRARWIRYVRGTGTILVCMLAHLPSWLFGALSRLFMRGPLE